MEGPNDLPSSIEIEEQQEKNEFMRGITIFISELKDGALQFSIKSEDFFKNLKKGIQINLSKLKSKWNKLIFGEKEEKNVKLTKKLMKKYQTLERKLAKIESTTTTTHELAKQIKEDTSQIMLDINDVSLILEMVMDRVDNVEDYMKRNLGSDWNKIKNHWLKYKNDEITKGEFIKFGLKSIGKKFLSIFINISG
ncbi:MAG: hypothetical protein ACFFBP_14275 [Promethearchaeota archaeon]